MIKVKTKIPSGSLTLLTKPNAAGECAVYLRYYLGSRYEENYRKAKSPSAYHDSIISLMKSSIPQIRSIAA